MVMTEVTETPEFTFDSFLNALGGSLSLFLGFSLIAAFEFIEFIILCSAEIIMFITDKV